MVVSRELSVLGNDSGQVVCGRVGGDARALPATAFDDARCTRQGNHHSESTRLNAYMNSFLHSNAQFYIICNHLVFFFTVGGT